MRSNQERGDDIARMIKRFGGWLDGDFVRFRTPDALAQFERALTAARCADAASDGASA